jgi:hypothetical protein
MREEGRGRRNRDEGLDQGLRIKMRGLMREEGKRYCKNEGMSMREGGIISKYWILPKCHGALPSSII